MSRILMTSILALALTAGTAIAQSPAAAPPADGLGGPSRLPGDGLRGQGRPFGGGLRAQDRAPGHGGIAALDTDRDGFISKTEWTMGGRPAARFDMVDINHDNKIDRQEIASARGAVARGGGLRGGQPGSDTPQPAAPTS